MKDRGIFAQRLASLNRFGITQRFVQISSDTLPVRRYRPKKMFKVRWSDNIDATGVKLWVAHKRHQSSIPSETSAENADTLWIRDICFHCPSGSVGNVVN